MIRTRERLVVRGFRKSLAKYRKLLQNVPRENDGAAEFSRALGRKLTLDEKKWLAERREAKFLELLSDMDLERMAKAMGIDDAFLKQHGIA